jgi:TRAP-type C4-dicarboxylate transport system substrate-binding protein
MDTIEVIGGQPDPHAIDHFWQNALSEGNTHNAVDTTLPRVLATVDKTNKRYIIDTQHSMFLTSIIVSESWWNSLSDEVKSIISQAATDAARLERQWSVDDANEIKNDAVKYGLEYKALEQSEMDKFRALTEPLYQKYDSIFMPGLLNGIIRG